MAGGMSSYAENSDVVDAVMIKMLVNDSGSPAQGPRLAHIGPGSPESPLARVFDLPISNLSEQIFQSKISDKQWFNHLHSNTYETSR